MEGFIGRLTADQWSGVFVSPNPLGLGSQFTC